MNLTEMPLCAFDLETTAPDPRWARVVTASVCKINGAKVEKLNWLANPGGTIPEEATAVHGITTEYAAEHGRDHTTVVTEIASTLYQAWFEGYAVVVFNAAYDMTVMSRQVEGFAPTGIIIDPFVIDRAVDPYRKGKRTLSAMCEHYGVKLGNAHEAEADALAAARLAWILRSLPALQGVDVMEWQANQHAERQASFADYLTKQGKSADDVCGDWPIRNRTEEKAA